VCARPPRYLYWVFEAKKRFGLCVLDYMVTSNHVHLLVKDTGSNVIAESMQLIAGRTAHVPGQASEQREEIGATGRADCLQDKAAGVSAARRLSAIDPNEAEAEKTLFQLVRLTRDCP
jgi:hypothetical protein